MSSIDRENGRLQDIAAEAGEEYAPLVLTRFDPERESYWEDPEGDAFTEGIRPYGFDEPIELKAELERVWGRERGSDPDRWLQIIKTVMAAAFKSREERDEGDRVEGAAGKPEREKLQRAGLPDFVYRF